MSIFSVVILVLAGLIIGALAVLIGLASTKPDVFRVVRKITIKASPEKIHPYLSDLKRGMEWSPWEKKDPQMKKTFSGPEQGVGSAYEWDGNKEIGAGRLEILSIAPEKIVMKLEFFRPMKGVNTVEYTLVPLGEYTEVSWAMFGPTPFIGKIFSVIIDCDAMVGTEFESGLSTLKTLCERP